MMDRKIKNSRPAPGHSSMPLLKGVKVWFVLAATMLSGSLTAAPDAYSINSDSATANADSLYVIDLATGNDTRIGTVTSLGQTRIDVEGLALAPDGTLYGMDDSALTLFPINPANGVVVHPQEVNLQGLPTGGGNDFGMSFACDGNLYVTSVDTQTLYRVSLNGQATPVGTPGSLQQNISAIAAFGNPVQLYGLSSGAPGANPGTTRTLFSINPQTGVATPIGNLGAAALLYHEAGLSFDGSGVLWAITDRRDDVGFALPGQVLQINTGTGQATAISTTSEAGFESLAVSVPGGCLSGGGEAARFAVDKRFMDHNDVDGATFTLSCNTGLPLEQSKTVVPVGGSFVFEVEFVVTDFASGTLDCALSEQPVQGYTATYNCDGVSACDAGAPSPLDAFFRGPCSFSDVEEGDENTCFIRNYVDAVDIDVTKVWIDEHPEFVGPTNAQLAWACVNVRSSGNDVSPGEAEGVLTFSEQGQTRSFSVFPNFDAAFPSTCSVTEDAPGFDSDIESDDSDCQGVTVSPGVGASCTVVNTRFFEGIPTLGEYGKLLLALLLLAAGLVAARRV